MNNSIIDIEKLGYSFHPNSEMIFKEVNLKVYQQDIIALLGDNGSGKTTLLKCISGIIHPKVGQIRFNGKSLSNWQRQDLAKRMAFVPSRINYSALLRVHEFVAFGRYPFTNWLGKLTDGDKEIVSFALTQCAVSELTDKKMSELSDGERQKVAIARAIAQSTDTLVLDEPTTHLDIKNVKAIFNLLKSFTSKENKTVLFSTHQVEQALKIANKLWLFNENEILQCSPKEFENSEKLQAIIFG